MKQYCLTLDLKNDPELIQAYLEYHQNVWEEVLDSIRVSGILSMQIYHIATRLVMFIQANDNFSFDEKAKMDADNEKVQEWETLMDKYQQRLPFTAPDEKWILMNKIFEL